MERTLISWNLPNWITVMLMAALGYVVVAIIMQFVPWGGQQQAPGTGGGF